MVQARALWGGAHVAVYNDDDELARDLAGQAQAVAAIVGDEWTEARALNTMGYALALWGPDDARPVLERSIALGRRLADDWVIADGLKMLSIDHMARDDLDGIAETAAELQRVAETLDNGFFLAWADAVLGIRDLRRGDLGAAREKLEASIAALPRSRRTVDRRLGHRGAERGGGSDGRHRRRSSPRAEFIAHANATGGHLGVSYAVLVVTEIMLGGTEQDGARALGRRWPPT